MKDEIKEILEALKPQDEEFTKAGIKEYPLYLSRKQQDLLLDYITNLQEKSNNQAEEINRLYKQRKKFMKKYGYLKEENERLIKLKEKYQLKKEVYKSRNEKVIQYIDSLFNTIDYDDEEFITFETLENIQNLAKYGQLNGGDEEC